MRRRCGETPQLETRAIRLGRDREGWQERDARPAGDHLHQSGQARGAKFELFCPGFGAYGQRLLSNRTCTLITKVDGQHVLVLLDEAEHDVNLRRPGNTGPEQDLHLFKRRLGGLVLYEVTPLDQPHVIQEFKPVE